MKTIKTVKWKMKEILQWFVGACKVKWCPNSICDTPQSCLVNLPLPLKVIHFHISGPGYKIGPVCVCLFMLMTVMSALTAEPFHVWTQNLVEELTLNML